MASKVEKRTALAFPDFNMDKFAVVIPMISAKSLLFILRLASMTSKLTIIDIGYMVNSFSSFAVFATLNTSLNTMKNKPKQTMNRYGLNPK